MAPALLLTNAIHVRENEIRAHSVQPQEDAIELDKPLEDGVDVGLGGVWW